MARAAQETEEFKKTAKTIGSIATNSILTSIQTGSGEPIFSIGKNSTQTQAIIDGFISQELISPESLLKFSSDVMVVKSGAPESDNPYYGYYQKDLRTNIDSKLQYNYNMTTGSVDNTMSNIIKNITKELSPPKASKTFTYDFKFSQNQNASISGSSGGAY